MKKRWLVLLMLAPLFLAGCFGRTFKDPCEAQSNLVGSGYNAIQELAEPITQGEENLVLSGAKECLEAAEEEIAKYLTMELSVLSFERTGVSTLVKQDGDGYIVSYSNMAFRVERSKEKFLMRDINNPFEDNYEFSLEGNAFYMTSSTDGNLELLVDYVEADAKFVQIAYKVNDMFKIIKLKATGQDKIQSFSVEYMLSAFAPTSLKNGIASNFGVGAGSVTKNILN